MFEKADAPRSPPLAYTKLASLELAVLCRDTSTNVRGP